MKVLQVEEAYGYLYTSVCVDQLFHLKKVEQRCRETPSIDAYPSQLLFRHRSWFWLRVGAVQEWKWTEAYRGMSRMTVGLLVFGNLQKLYSAAHTSAFHFKWFWFSLNLNYDVSIFRPWQDLVSLDITKFQPTDIKGINFIHFFILVRYLVSNEALKLLFFWNVVLYFISIFYI